MPSEKGYTVEKGNRSVLLGAEDEGRGYLQSASRKKFLI